MLCQMHCLRRDAARSDTPFLIVRDECGQTLHPGWDLQVSAVARSQKLAVIDITQDLDVLMQGLGGEQSRHEVTGFAALHQTRLMFGSTNAEMNELHSRMLGDRREVQVGGGSGGGSPPDADFADRLLGVTVGFSWSEHYEPWVRPGDFAKLRPGQAYLALGGQTFGKRPYHWADFWRR